MAEGIWAGRRNPLGSQVKFAAISSQRALRCFALFCFVFLCKPLIEVLKMKSKSPLLWGLCTLKDNSLVSVWLFYCLVLTYIESLTLNKAILQMKSLTGEVGNCDSRAWCQADPHISNNINGGGWFYNQSFNPDIRNSTMSLGSLNLNKLA